MFANRQQFAHPELFSQLARDAEQLGFESIWTVEHVVVPLPHTPYPATKDGKMRGGDDAPIPDPLIPLAYAAALTTKLKLATGIVILPQHHPLYLAKQVATLDVLSHGRVILGIGSGWMKEEFAAVGVDFHKRGALTDESIQAMRALWRDYPASFHGKHFNFDNLKSLPKPTRKEGVPIHVGGHSPAAARRAGRLGDGFFGQIILRGPEPAAQDQQIGPLPRLPDHGHHAGKVVAHGALPVEVDAQIGERAAEERGVRVHDLAQQKFGPNGDDFSGHGAGSERGFGLR